MIAADDGSPQRCGHVVHWGNVVLGATGLLLLTCLLVGIAASSLPVLVLIGLSTLLWKGFWTTVYHHIYIRHLGWLHLKILRKQGTRLSLKWKEVPGIPIGEDGKSARVFAIVNFVDNYCWLVVEYGGGGVGGACLIDPGDAEPVCNALVEISEQALGLREGNVVSISAILTTHHHWDHMGANLTLPKLLRSKFPHCCGDPSEWEVYAGGSDSVVGVTQTCRDGDIVSVGEDLQFEVIEAPCHTSGSVMFYLRCRDADPEVHPEVSSSVLFSGDTCFNGGAGASFEGDEVDMTRNHATIVERCYMPSYIYSGHEYGMELLQKELACERNLHRPTAFFRAASAYYFAVHRVTCGHPSVPIVTLSSVMSLCAEFRKVYDAALVVAQAAYYSLSASEKASLNPPPDPVANTPDQNHFPVDAPPKTPSAALHPFTTLYTRDLEEIEAGLVSGQLKPATAALALKKLRAEWGEAGRRPGYHQGHDVVDRESIKAALLLIGVRPPASIKKPLCGSIPDVDVSFQRLHRVFTKVGLHLKVCPSALLNLVWDKVGSFPGNDSFSYLRHPGPRNPIPLSQLLDAITPAREASWYLLRNPLLTPDLVVGDNDNCPLCKE